MHDDGNSSLASSSGLVRDSANAKAIEDRTAINDPAKTIARVRGRLVFFGSMLLLEQLEQLRRQRLLCLEGSASIFFVFLQQFHGACVPNCSWAFAKVNADVTQVCI